jgi:hypothetical protein
MQGKKILFIFGAANKEHPSDDELVKRHLQKMDFRVTTATAADPASRADGQDLIVISSTVTAHELQGKYRDVPVPVFTWNTPNYPYMNMTGPKMHEDFEIVDPVQHWARSFAGGHGYIASATNPIAHELGLKSQLFGALYFMPQTWGWGRPSAGGTVVSNFEGDPTRAGIFTYEKGASMYGGFVAPARRVGFYIQDNNFHQLTELHGPGESDPDLAAWWVGLKLFDASIRWAVSPPAQPAPFDPALLHQQLAQVAKGKKVLFVCRMNTPEGKEADDHIVNHLQELGFIVTQADQSEPQSLAEGQDVIIISGTNSKFKLGNKYRDTTIPVLCLEGMSADILKMAGRIRYVDYGEHGAARESEDPPETFLDIVASYHPMAAGLKPGPVRFIKRPHVLKWATPSPGAVIIATLPSQQHEGAILGYEKGATMANDFIAPARRTLFPLDNPSFDDLTEAGLGLFDAAVLWTVGPPFK